MKILHLINSLETGGAEKLLLDSLPLYADLGITADLLLLKETDSLFLKELKEKECCSIYSLGLVSVYNPIHVFKMIPFFKKYDLIHVHLFPAQYYAVFAKILFRSKVKLVFTEHNGTNRRLNNAFFRMIDRQIYKFYSRTICITQEIKEILVKHTGLPSAKFPVIENGVNLTEIASAAAYSKVRLHSAIMSGDLVVIQVAAFREQKDHETLIKAMLLLPHYIKLILVGTGLLKIKFEKMVVSLGLEKRIFFFGVRRDIPQLLKTADVVVLSSRYEGLSLSSIEGMASGKPFLASAVPGLIEVVAGAGILFPVGDEKHLAKEILHLANDPTHYAATANKCMMRAKEYDILTMVRGHIALYHDIVLT